ncbi:NAC domain-containing protein 21/22, partial [Ananas comosus]
IGKDTKGGGGGLFCGCPALVAVDLNKCEPWDLPETACVGGRLVLLQPEDRSTRRGCDEPCDAVGLLEGHGKDRACRGAGRWSACGRRSYSTRPGPQGKKTPWVMHEFRIERHPRRTHPPPPPPPPSPLSR